MISTSLLFARLACANFHNRKSEQSVLLPLRLVKQACCRNRSGIQLRHPFNVIIRESG
jgi:hypothetical protein